MIVENKEVAKSANLLDKKHIFVIILALKQLCVHPMILLRSTYEELNNLPTSSQESNDGAINSEDEMSPREREMNFFGNAERLQRRDV